MTDRHFVPAAPGFWRLELVRRPHARDGAFKICRERIVG
jgi:hypothetical protein